MKSAIFNLWSRPLEVALLSALAQFGSSSANAQTYPEVVLQDNPLAYYRFEDAVGSTTVADSSAAGTNVGTINFDDYALWPQLGLPGLDSNSIGFHLYTTNGNAEQGNVSVPYTPYLNPPGTFSIECWVLATSWATTSHRCPLSSVENYNYGWWLRQSDESPNRWLYVQNGGGIYMSAGNVTLGEWTHLVITYDGTTVTFYGNGAPLWTSTTTPNPNLSEPLLMGGNPGFDGYWDGDLDEVAIYSNALSADRVLAHYETGTNSIRTAAVAAYVVQDPTNASDYSGQTASFLVTAGGTLPLSYQWYGNSALISGATNDSLNFTCSYPADNGATYTVVITNRYGSVTSTPAVLTVMTNLLIVSSPASITRNTGSKAAFIVVPGGALPNTFQWYEKTTEGTSPIPDATNQVLWLSNLQLADDQSEYFATVSNPWTNNTSDPATLTVVPRTEIVPITGYAKIVMAADPVAYWRLDETNGSATAVDAAGSFDGTYTSGNGSITYGVPSGIPYDTVTAISVTNGADVEVPWALELNPQGPFTTELWFQPESESTSNLVVAASYPAVSGSSPPYGWWLYQQPNSTMAWVLFGPNWNYTAFSYGGGPIAAKTWYYAALTYDGTLFRTYLNGSLAAEQPYAPFDFAQTGYTSFGYTFNGALADVAIYNKALPSELILDHFNATVELSIAQSGTNVVLSWPLGTLQSATNVNGPYTKVSSATSPFTNAISLTQQYYRLQVQ
jgi:hypothetical protein